MKLSSDFLKNNPVFWSRLGFCYDPPLTDENGKPIVFTKDLDKYASFHRDFSKEGVKIHTCILHLGWVGVDKYDYSLTDRVLESVFKDNEDIYFIPRIKLNVPIDWCRENPEEVFVYHDGPREKERIRELVGTLKQDYIGYDSPNGYYQAGEYVDPRPNVGGIIARQSFSSKKWLNDAGVALEKLIDRLENGKYGNRIIGYHIAHGTSGECVMWGRISGRYGDYGITNRREFYNWGLNKYKTKENLENAWCQKGITAKNVIIPSPYKRIGKTEDLEEFMRANAEDKICIDYDTFVSEMNADAILHFAKIAKKTGKLVGTFYGYFMHVDNVAYAGHLAIDKLLNSQYIDFLAAPKSYYRCGPGEPGGELCPAQSINLKKLWVDELDNRTHLAEKEQIPENLKGKIVQDTSEWLSKSQEQTVSVMLREFSKNLSHDSGFWWMDLGGGWYDSKYLLTNVSKCVKLNESLRLKTHKSVSDVLIVVDENSAKYVRANGDMRKGFMEDFIYETAMSGTLADVYRLSDLTQIDLSRYKLIVFAYTIYLEPEYFEEISNKIPKDTTLMFNYAAGAWNREGFSLENTEKLTGYKVKYTKNNPNGYDFPQIEAEEKIIEKRIINVTPYLKRDKIREIAKNAGCHIFTEQSGITLYGDNRFLGIFNNDECNLNLKFKERSCYYEITQNKYYENVHEINVQMPEKSALVFLYSI